MMYFPKEESRIDSRKKIFLKKESKILENHSISRLVEDPNSEFNYTSEMELSAKIIKNCSK